MSNITKARDILVENGYNPDKEIIQDGNIHRFGKSHWYICYGNYLVAGDWKNRLPAIKQIISPNGANENLTPYQKDDLERKIKAEKRQRDLERSKQYKEASIKAAEIWQNLSDNGTSIYLNNKELSAIEGIKFGKDMGGNFIATALIDNQGTINSLQFIYDNATYDNKFKKFLKGSRTQGYYGEFGNKDSQTIFICEGVATGLSILLAKTDCLVIVAYNCGNLKKVAKNITVKYPNHKIIIAGDNDLSKPNNIGREKAEEAAKEFNLSIVLPIFKNNSTNPSDFDDLRQLEGIEEVKKQLQITRNPKEIIPIKNDNLKLVRAFDIDNFLPDELRGFVKDVSERLSVPADFVAIPLIVGFSSIIAGKVAMKPKKNDSFCVFPNLWGGLIGNPSTRKTPSLKEALFFFSTLENAAKETYDNKSKDYKKEFEKYKLIKKALEDKYNQLSRAGKDTEEILSKLYSLQEPEKVSLERYRINEATTQKITEILRDNQSASVLLERDELAGFLSNLNKKENEGDRSYYLEMWNGNATVRNDTIGRGSIIANNAAISIVGTTQPDLIKGYLKKTITSLNDGLLQRFQLLVYPDSIKNDYTDKKPNEEAKNQIVRIANFLNDADFFSCASGSIEKDGKNYPYISFNEEAQEIYQKWHIENDKKVNQLYKNGKPLISQHLSKYHKLLPALCLIFHLVRNQTGEKTINATTLSKAILFCNYLESHANRIYSLLSGEDGYNNAALELIEKIQAKIIKKGEESTFLKEFTKRDLSRAFGSYSNDDLENIINILVEHNYFIEKLTLPSFQQKEKRSYFLNSILIKEIRNGQ